MRFCEMREKEVVNICTGKQLGCVVDLELDTCSGKIESIIVPGPGKFCGFFGTDCEYVIPYSCVKKNRTGCSISGNKRRKVFAKILDIVYNEGGNKFVSQTD